MNRHKRLRTISAFIFILNLNGQVRVNLDPVPLKHWSAPLYWKPEITPIIFPTGVSTLVFVAMTPCRLVDTRASQGFPPAFGAPALVASASRTFPLESSTSCSIPSAAQTYSLNITVVPSASAGLLTAYPTGQALPLAAALVWSQGNITSNAVIVPGGLNGSIDVYVDAPTDVVIDINGYYAPNGYVPTGSNNTALGTMLFFITPPAATTPLSETAL